MNSNFRSPELVKRYEYTYYDLETPLNDNVTNLHIPLVLAVCRTFVTWTQFNGLIAPTSLL